MRFARLKYPEDFEEPLACNNTAFDDDDCIVCRDPCPEELLKRENGRNRLTTLIIRPTSRKAIVVTATDKELFWEYLKQPTDELV